MPELKIEKDAALSRHCKRIREHRETKNQAANDEALEVAGALHRMQTVKPKIESYKDHGVELVHTTTDKLRVRLIDDDENSDAAEAEA